MYSGFYTEEKSKASNSDLFLFSQEDLETKLFPLSPPEVCKYTFFYSKIKLVVKKDMKWEIDHLLISIRF